MKSSAPGPKEDLDDVRAVMKNRRIRHLPVCDGERQPAGSDLDRRLERLRCLEPGSDDSLPERVHLRTSIKRKT